MNKVKISSGFASIILVACLFAGWQTMLIVTLLLLAYTDIEEKVKDVAIRVITFYIGLSLFTLAWGLVYDGITLITGSIGDVIGVLSHYMDKPLDITDIQNYIISPISEIAKIADNVVGFLITLAKFGFIVALLTGKAAKENVVSKKINEYVSKAISFVQTQSQAAVQQAPVQNNAQQ